MDERDRRNPHGRCRQIVNGRDPDIDEVTGGRRAVIARGPVSSALPAPGVGKFQRRATTHTADGTTTNTATTIRLFRDEPRAVTTRVSTSRARISPPSSPGTAAQGDRFDRERRIPVLGIGISSVLLSKTSGAEMELIGRSGGSGMDLELGVVFGLLLLFVTGATASWRGRSVLWGLLVFPLGPLPLLALLLLPARERPSPP